MRRASVSCRINEFFPYNNLLNDRKNGTLRLQNSLCLKLKMVAVHRVKIRLKINLARTIYEKHYFPSFIIPKKM